MKEKEAREIVEAAKRPGSIILVDDPHKAEEYIGIAKGYLQGLADERKRLKGLVEILDDAHTVIANLVLELVMAKVHSATMERHSGIGVRINKAIVQYCSQSGQGE